jgi:type I restriction enzyme S subunit
MTLVKLGELCAIRSGGTPSRNNSAFYGGQIPWAKISDIETSDGVVCQTEETITNQGLAAIRGRIFPRGTLLFAIYGSIGKMAFAGQELSTNQAILGIENLRPDALCERYLFRYLESRRDALLSDGAGIAQKNLSAGYVRDIEIPLPPLEEQKRIAAILDQADELRRKRQHALDRLNQLGQTIFTEMFGDGFSFNRAALKSLGKVSTGSTPPTSDPRNFGGPVPFITPSDLDSASPIKRNLSEQGATKSRIVSAGATLVCCIGSIGKMRKAETRSAFNQQINAIEWGSQIDADFGFFAIQRQRHVIEQIGKRAATTIPIIKKSEFEKLEVFCPPLTEQREFARRLKGLKHPILVAKVSSAKAEQLFASLQHRAFRGELTTSSPKEASA